MKSAQPIDKSPPIQIKEPKKKVGSLVNHSKLSLLEWWNWVTRCGHGLEIEYNIYIYLWRVVGDEDQGKKLRTQKWWRPRKVLEQQPITYPKQTNLVVNATLISMCTLKDPGRGLTEFSKK